MSIVIKEENLTDGILGLVIALVEVITDTLKLQALKRIESGVLNEDECERLGKALMDLDGALEAIKSEHGLGETVQSVRAGLDNAVSDLVTQLSLVSSSGNN